MKKLTIILLAFTCLLSVCTTAKASDFKDIPENYSLDIEINYLIERDIISGYPDGTFKPNALIAKKHIASMMVKALDLSTDNVKNPHYKDVPTSHPYYKEIAAAYTAGIFGDAQYFKPESNISRAFMAKILTTAFHLQPIGNTAKTYKDVPKKHASYNVIQLVSMNNIAHGSTHEAEDGQLTYTFKPNQLLTRAHFSAFLARAMSLQTDDYLPDPNYVYYHISDYEDFYLRFSHYDSDYGVNSGIWELTHFQSDGTISYSDLVYGVDNNTFYLGYKESESVYAVQHPFTIGLKSDTLQNDMYPSRQEIVATDASLTIDGESFDDVIVVKYTGIDWLQVNGESIRNGYSSEYMYIAKERGIIGFSDDIYTNIEPFYLERIHN